MQRQAGLGHSAEDAVAAAANRGDREQEPVLERSRVGPQRGSGWCGVGGTEGTSNQAESRKPNLQPLAFGNL